MAIKDEDFTASAPGMGYPSAPPAGGGFAPPEAAPRKTWSFFSMPSTPGLSRTPASEVLTKAMTALTELFMKELSKDLAWEVSVLSVDNTKETRLSLSSVVVCVRSKAHRELGVSYHTLLLEGSGEPVPDYVNSQFGRPINVSRFAADVFTPTYREIVHATVSRAFSSNTCSSVSGEVVPRSFNWEDKNAVRQLAANASFPGITDLEVRTPDYADVDLTAMTPDASLQVRLNFNALDRVDYAGLPVRNDLSVDLVATEQRQDKSNGLDNQSRNKVASTLGGYIDLVWAPQAPQNVYGQAAQGPQHKFSARYVMTNLENQMRLTLAAQIMTLATALGLSEPTSWYPYYTPRQLPNDTKVDLKNIGAINIEANILNEPGPFGSPMETKAATFTKLNLGQLLSGAVRPGMTFTLSVSQLGADTWCNEVFSLAAQGNPRAAQAIIGQTNLLTGGHFHGFYNSTENPIIVNEDLIFNGFYVGDDGKKRDIRDIDHLAVLNLVGQKDPAAGQAWSDTFLRTDFPLIQRLQERKKMYSELLRGEVTFTGMSRLCTFTNKYLVALGQAVKAAGLNARLVSPAMGGGYEDQRGVATFLPQSLIAPGSINIFTPGYSGGAGNTSGYGQPAADRYGRYGV